MIAMKVAALCCHLAWTKGLDTPAPEGDVDNLLVHWENFISQRVHIHTLCEYN